MGFSLEGIFKYVGLRNLHTNVSFTTIFNLLFTQTIVPSCIKSATIITSQKAPDHNRLNSTSRSTSPQHWFLIHLPPEVTTPLQTPSHSPSSVFSTVIPDILINKLMDLHFPPSTCVWIKDVLFNRPKHLKLGPHTQPRFSPGLFAEPDPVRPFSRSTAETSLTLSLPAWLLSRRQTSCRRPSTPRRKVLAALCPTWRRSLPPAASGGPESFSQTPSPPAHNQLLSVRTLNNNCAIIQIIHVLIHKIAPLLEY